MTIAEVTGNGSDTVVLMAPLSAINATLAAAGGLIFTPASDINGDVTLSMNTDDQGHNGVGGPQSDSDSATISIAAVNDGPVNTLPASALTVADTPLALSGVSIADVDAGSATISVVLNVTHGVLMLNTSVASGVTSSQVLGNGTGLVTVLSTLAEMNATLADANGLVFTPEAAFAGTATLTVVTKRSRQYRRRLNGRHGCRINCRGAVPDHFTIDAPPTRVAGEGFSVTVTARDESNNVVSDFGG